MALTLKDGLTYNNRYDSTDPYTDAYAVVDECNGNKKTREQRIVLEIYANKAARDAGDSPIDQLAYTVEGDDFDTFFSVAAIDADDNQYKKAYEYLLQLKKKDEEGREIEEYEWEDWESDEQA
ncbi:MAG: hypothetical protein ACFFDH_00010 [Promethearchaeota archaeon]